MITKKTRLFKLRFREKDEKYISAPIQIDSITQKICATIVIIEKVKLKWQNVATQTNLITQMECVKTVTFQNTILKEKKRQKKRTKLRKLQSFKSRLKVLK
jgi:hypothetical protein